MFVCALVLYRKDFRQAFKLIGELRSLIPTTTNVLACTATATVAIYEEVTKVLALENPHVVALTPDRANITYSVLPKQEFDGIVEAICTKLSKLVTPLQFPKTVIFCQRYACVCVHLYNLSTGQPRQYSLFRGCPQQECVLYMIMLDIVQDTVCALTYILYIISLLYTFIKG